MLPSAWSPEPEMITGLRGDPSRHSLEDLRAAASRGVRASEGFLRRLEADPRAGAGAVARQLRRAEERRREGEAMLALERAAWARGHERVAGVDEAGMGPLAGPVVAAAVILRPSGPIPEARDSKVLDAPAREALAAEVREHALAVGVGISTVEDIASLDVYQAGLLAMRRAVEALQPAPDALLVDARTIPGARCPQEAHVKGDARSRSIAAASIIAKTERDAIMARLAVEHPGYGFERHAGYATPEHLEALRRLGPCPAHRTSWAALAEHAGELSDAFYELRDALRQAEDARALRAWTRRAQALSAGMPPEEVRRLDLMARRKERQLAGRADSSGATLPFGP